MVPDALASRLTIRRPSLPGWLDRAEVRGLRIAGSRVDPVIRRELEGFPDGYTVAFAVLGESMGVRVTRRGPRFALSRPRDGRPDLQIMFKHLAHAFALLSFQESTPRAYANARSTSGKGVVLATFDNL